MITNAFEHYTHFSWESSAEFSTYWKRYSEMRNNYSLRFDNNMPEDMQNHIWQELVNECKAAREKSK